jgi:hypothetical protein
MKKLILSTMMMFSISAWCDEVLLNCNIPAGAIDEVTVYQRPDKKMYVEVGWANGFTETKPRSLSQKDWDAKSFYYIRNTTDEAGNVYKSGLLFQEKGSKYWSYERHDDTGSGDGDVDCD